MRRLTSYKGLTSLVTGASSGIGRELARRFAREGARVALVARRKADLEATALEIRKEGGTRRFYRATSSKRIKLRRPQRERASTSAPSTSW